MPDKCLGGWGAMSGLGIDGAITRANISRATGDTRSTVSYFYLFLFL